MRGPTLSSQNTRLQAGRAWKRDNKAGRLLIPITNLVRRYPSAKGSSPGHSAAFALRLDLASKQQLRPVGWSFDVGRLYGELVRGQTEIDEYLHWKLRAVTIAKKKACACWFRRYTATPTATSSTKPTTTTTISSEPTQLQCLPV